MSVVRRVGGITHHDWILGPQNLSSSLRPCLHACRRVLGVPLGTTDPSHPDRPGHGYFNPPKLTSLSNSSVPLVGWVQTPTPRTSPGGGMNPCRYVPGRGSVTNRKPPFVRLLLSPANVLTSFPSGMTRETWTLTG